jgi:prophage DNA circulation protein
MPRSDVRELLAGMAQIGDVRFWATRVTKGPNPRRIMQYTGVGVDGASTEDLGMNARTETLTAIVEEDVFNRLDLVKNAAKEVTIVHPLFDAFNGRLMDVVPEANPDDMLDIVVTVCESGDPIGLFVASAPTTASAKQATTSAFDDLGLDDLDGLADFPTSSGLPSAGTGMNNSWAGFASVMDAVDSADALWTDVSAAYNDLASAGNVLIDTIDAYVDATQDMIDIVDSTYELLDEARRFVDAMEKQSGSVWQDLKITTPLSLAEIALELIGNDTEETIDLILDRNPTLIDLNAVPVGVTLSIPVVL